MAADLDSDGALFWRAEADGFAVEALELAGTGGRDGTRYRIFLVQDGRRKVLGHMDGSGAYEPWTGRTAGARADGRVLKALRELKDVILTTHVMES